MCLNHPDSIPLPLVQWKPVFHKTGEVQWSQSCSFISDSLQPPGLYSLWNSPGQNTGVCRCSLLQGIFPTQESNLHLLHCGHILYQLSHHGSQEYWSGWPIPSPVDPPNPGIEPGSPALQADSLSTEPSGEPIKLVPGAKKVGDHC